MTVCNMFNSYKGMFILFVDILVGFDYPANWESKAEENESWLSHVAFGAQSKGCEDNKVTNSDFIFSAIFLY